MGHLNHVGPLRPLRRLTRPRRAALAPQDVLRRGCESMPSRSLVEAVLPRRLRPYSHLTRWPAPAAPTWTASRATRGGAYAHNASTG